MEITAIAPMLAVADVRRSAFFYQQVLCLPLRSSFTPEGTHEPAWASLGAGAVELMLSRVDQATGPADRASLYLRVPDVTPVLERARAAGLEVRGPFVRFYKIKEIELRDPDGFLLIVGADTDDPPTPE